MKHMLVNWQYMPESLCDQAGEAPGTLKITALGHEFATYDEAAAKVKELKLDGNTAIIPICLYSPSIDHVMSISILIACIEASRLQQAVEALFK